MFRRYSCRCRFSALSKLCYYSKQFCDACFNKESSNVPILSTSDKATANKDKSPSYLELAA